jgi:hypothetical protein
MLRESVPRGGGSLASRAPGSAVSLRDAKHGRAIGDDVVSQLTNGKRRPKDVAEPETTKLRLYAQLGLRLPAELALRLRRYCQASGKSANKAVMEALTQYLAEHER